MSSGSVLQLDPVVIGANEDEDERRRAAARAEAERILAESGATRELERLREAEAIGDAYRADPANRHPDPFGSHAARVADRGPEASGLPPAPALRPAPEAQHEPRTMHLEPVVFGGAEPEVPPAPASTPMQLEPVDPAVGYGAPPAAPMPESEPQAPAAMAPAEEAEGPSVVASESPSPVQAAPPAPAVPPAPPSSALGAPPMGAPPPEGPRAELEQLLSARLAQRPLPSATPADAGPIQAPDFTGADVSDAIRRPLHALANAFRAAGGRPSAPFRSEREAMERRLAQERRALARESKQEDQLALARERLALDRDRLDLDREDRAERREISRAMQEGRLDVARDRADIARRAAELRSEGLGEQEALRRARREALEYELTTARAMRDPASPESASARAELMAELDTLRDEIGFDPPPAVREMLSAASGEQVQRYRETLIRSGVLRPRTSRRGGGGGRGARQSEQLGDVPPEILGTDEDPLVREAVRLGMNPAVARDMARDTRKGRAAGRTRLQSLVGTQSFQRGRLRDHAIIAGWERDPNATLLTPSESRALNRIATADREFEAAANALQRLLGELSAGERVTGRFRVGSERYYEIQHRLDVIRNQMRQISDMGNSLGAQEELRHMVPNLDDNVTARAILNNVRAAQRTKRDYVLAIMGNYGYRPAREGGQGGGQRRSTSTSPDTVRVRHPDGRTGTIPRANLERALSAGFEEVR